MSDDEDSDEDESLRHSLRTRRKSIRRNYAESNSEELSDAEKTEQDDGYDAAGPQNNQDEDESGTFPITLKIGTDVAKSIAEKLQTSDESNPNNDDDDEESSKCQVSLVLKLQITNKI